jgi:uroporphyrinogen-III synthase
MTARPLVALTRDDGPDGRFAAALAARGLEAFVLPTIAIRPGADGAYLDAALAGLAREDWLVFTSAHAVAAVVQRTSWNRLGAGARPRIGAVGAATAARLRESGAPPNLLADEPGARGLAAALARNERLDDVHVVWPRSERARPELAERLRASGARVTELVAYRTEPVASPRLADFQRLLSAARLAAITFLSPSSATDLAAALGASDLGLLAGRTLVASIGPTTSAALRTLQAPPQIEASRPALEALADALAASLTGAAS